MKKEIIFSGIQRLKYYFFTQTIGTAPDPKTNHLSRGSPHSKSLKHPSLAPEAKQPQRRSVPNVLEDVETMQRLEAATTSAGTLKAADSSSTTIHKEEDQLQLKWEAVMDSKFTIVVCIYTRGLKSNHPSSKALQ